MQLLYSSENEGWAIAFLAVILLIPILAVIFSIVCIIAPRGRMRWTALVFTILFTWLEFTFYRDLDKHSNDHAGLIPLFCFSLIATRFWLLSGRRFFYVKSALWAILMLTVLGTLLEDDRGQHLLRSRSLRHIVPFVPMILEMLAAALIGIKVLQAAVRRKIPLPELATFVAVSILIIFIATALVEAFAEFQYYFSGSRTIFNEPDIFTQVALHLISSATAATFAWMFVQHRNSPRTD